jgi:hypothetical protein
MNAAPTAAASSERIKLPTVMEAAKDTTAAIRK